MGHLLHINKEFYNISVLCVFFGIESIENDKMTISKFVAFSEHIIPWAFTPLFN